MDLETLGREIRLFTERSGLNTVRAEDALAPECAGVPLFDEPLLAAADASDPLFTGLFREDGVIGPHFRAPAEWLPGARSVLSFFLPFSEAVRASNRIPAGAAGAHSRCCSDLWLHGRIEGQRFLSALSEAVCSFLREEGFEAVAPSNSPDFRTVGPYSSNWSERHVAYAAGLGTFGLSRGLITRKGMAGRFGSVVTNAALPVTERPYSGPFDYCTLCGACQRRCPVGAIDAARGFADGKDQVLCGGFVHDGTLPPHGPRRVVRYGCGRCQVGVPCEHGIPPRGR